MPETTKATCLFIGGTADGERLPVDDIRTEHRILSLADVMNDPHALDDGDPRPEKTPVVEIYTPIHVTHDAGTDTVFALNGLGDDGIDVQLVKDFGPEAVFTRHP